MRCVSALKSAFIAITCLSVTGCHRSPTDVTAASPTRPLPEVDTFAAITKQIVDYREFTGRTTAVQTVDVRVQVNGYLLQSPQPQLVNIDPAEVHKVSLSHDSIDDSQSASRQDPSNDSFRVTIHEGDRVKIGTPLFEIDPAPYRFALAQAEGTFAATRAQLKRLSLDLARAKDLRGSNSISQAEYDSAVANEAEIVGQLETLRASVDRAKLNLQFTQVVSPIDGLLGRTIVTNGNLISADSTILTTIVSMDPIHAYFDVDEDSLLDYRARIRSGNVRSARESSIPVELGLANEEGFPHPGVIDFVNNTTDANTGNTRIRAQLQNPMGALSPGLFARIRVPFSEEHTAVLIPTRALAMDQQGRYVMVVDEKSVVHRRSVQIGSTRESMTVIVQGVQKDELVVVSGLQKIRDGATVAHQSTEEQE